MLRAYEAAFLKDDHAVMLDLMDDGIVFSDPLCGADITSREALKKYLSQANGVLTQIVQTIDERVAEGDKVFLRWVHEGVNGVTGQAYSFVGSTFLRVRGGAVVEHRDYFDARRLIKQFRKAAKHKKSKL